MLNKLLGRRDFLRVVTLSAAVVALFVIIAISMAASPVMATGIKTLPPMSRKVIISYDCHIEDFGNRGKTNAKRTCGTTDHAKRLEAFVIYIDKKPGNEDIQLWYRAWLQGTGLTDWHRAKDIRSWQKKEDWVGTTGESRRLEAFQLVLTGKDADKYEVYYRAYRGRKSSTEKVWRWGWTSWCLGTEWCGTFDQSRRIEAIQIYIADADADKTNKVNETVLFKYADQ